MRLEVVASRYIARMRNFLNRLLDIIVEYGQNFILGPIEWVLGLVFGVIIVLPFCVVIKLLDYLYKLCEFIYKRRNNE